MATTKKTSAITKVKLTSATYKDEPKTIMPTFINFFYGKNGSGKSTIAETIIDETGNFSANIEWQEGEDSANYQPLLYDANFIRNNMRLYDNLPGVFTVNKENIDITDQIAAKESVVTETNKAIEETKTKKRILETERDRIFDALKEKCWAKYKLQEKKFPKAPVTTKSKEALANMLLDITDGKEYDEASLAHKYAAAFDETSTAYDPFKIYKPTAMSGLPGFSLCKKIITGSSQSPFSEFVHTLGALGWIQDGHKRFHEKGDGVCPYCGQTLPADFEKQLASCFDKQYEKDIEQLALFRSKYEQEMRMAIDTLEHNQSIPILDLSQYNTQLDNLRKTYQLNMKELERKTVEPSAVVELEDTDAIIAGIDSLILECNKTIEVNNKIVGDRKKSQRECADEIRSHLAYELKDALAEYKSKKAVLDAQIIATDKEIMTKQKIKKDAQKDIEELGRQTVNTKESIDNINILLEDAGFQGFRIAEKRNTPNAYEIIREDGTSDDKLSEGERNFIMFLYFYQMVCGSKETADALREKIVVIDDPVTSMDSGSVFVVASLVREMVEVCRHSVDWDNNVKDKYRIRQIFIMTHSAYFHRSITYQMDSRENFGMVTFYLVRKDENNHSNAIACVRNSNEYSGISENYNPVKDTYEALWEEYQKATAPTPLLNVIRQILEYYFLHICRYTREEMREEILSALAGDDKKSDRCLAETMITQMSQSSTGFQGDIEFAEDSEDTQAVSMYRNTFKQIFDAMRQRQHYDRMANETTSEG